MKPYTPMISLFKTETSKELLLQLIEDLYDKKWPKSKNSIQWIIQFPAPTFPPCNCINFNSLGKKYMFIIIAEGKSKNIIKRKECRRYINWGKLLEHDD